MRLTIHGLTLVVATLGALCGTPARAAPFAPGVSHFAPAAISDAAPDRQALIVVPAFRDGGAGARGALAQSDAVAYRDLLRLLGFDVTVIAGEKRVDLDLDSRKFADQVKRDADVAVFVLGAILPNRDKLYIPASDLPEADRHTDAIATESVSLFDLLSRIAAAGPRQVVTIVDECGAGEVDPSHCAVGDRTVPDTVSAIVSRRVPPGATNGPLAGIATIRGDLLPLMEETDLSFLKLYPRLTERLAGTNVGITSTAALSRDFAFLPADFLARLRTPCNRIDPSSDAEALRTMPSLDPLVAACQRMAETYAFSPVFKDKLAAAREQRTAQKALTACEAATAYLDAYPTGRYRGAVGDHASDCVRARESSPSASQGSSLQTRAYAAVVTYYQRHDYDDGDTLSDLAQLYPAQVNNRGRAISRTQQIQDLTAYYGHFVMFHFRLVPDSLDYTGCRQEAACLIRGSVEVTSKRRDQDDLRTDRSDFSLRFDLNEPIKVVYECAVLQAAHDHAKPCE